MIRRRYQVNVTVSAIDSHDEPAVVLPRFTGSAGDFLRVLAGAADDSAMLHFRVRDDRTRRFAPTKGRNRGNVGYHLWGKVALTDRGEET